MTFNHRILRRRTLTASIAAGVAAIALATGGYAIASSGSSNGASTSANAATGGSDPVPPRSAEPVYEGRSGPGELSARGGHNRDGSSGE